MSRWKWFKRRAEPIERAGAPPGRLADGDTVCAPGQPRWADIVPTDEEPVDPPGAPGRGRHPGCG